MTQEEMEKEIKELKAENVKLVATCNGLTSRLTALQKRVRRIEVDFYKDLPEEEEATF